MYDRGVAESVHLELNLTLVYQSGGLVLAHNKVGTEHCSRENVCRRAGPSTEIS